MAIHPTILAWEIPWTEEPDGLQSMGSHRVRHSWSNLACTHAWYLQLFYKCKLTLKFRNFPSCPDSSVGKESACNAGDLGSIPGLGRCPGEGKGYPFQYSGLENSMDCLVHGVTKSWTWMSIFHFHFSYNWCCILLIISKGCNVWLFFFMLYYQWAQVLSA